MANRTTSFYLSDETIAKLDAIVEHKMTGMNSNRSAAVETVITEAYANLKRIEPIRDRKGRTVGHRAYYGSHIVGDFDLLDKDGAQLALDRFAYEELSK